MSTHQPTEHPTNPIDPFRMAKAEARGRTLIVAEEQGGQEAVAAANDDVYVLAAILHERGVTPEQMAMALSYLDKHPDLIIEVAP